LYKALVAYVFAISVFLVACMAEEPVLTTPTPRSTPIVSPTIFVTQRSTEIPLVPTPTVDPKILDQINQYSTMLPQLLITSVADHPLFIKQTVDGIVVELKGYKTEKGSLILEFCFTPPSDDFWLFDEIVLVSSNQEFSPKEQRYISGRVDGVSCGNLTFPFDQNTKSSGVELFIGQLQTDYIHPDCNKANANLDKAKPTIVVKAHCFTNEAGGEGYRIETITKPESMSDEEVAALVRDAFSDTIDANFRFSFRVDP